MYLERYHDTNIGSRWTLRDLQVAKQIFLFIGSSTSTIHLEDIVEFLKWGADDKNDSNECTKTSNTSLKSIL